MPNADGTTLEVTVYASLEDDEPQVFSGYDYVSLVSGGTYGPPPLVAPNAQGRPAIARPGDKVLYINTSFCPLFEIERKAA